MSISQASRYIYTHPTLCVVLCSVAWDWTALLNFSSHPSRSASSTQSRDYLSWRLVANSVQVPFLYHTQKLNPILTTNRRFSYSTLVLPSIWLTLLTGLSDNYLLTKQVSLNLAVDDHYYSSSNEIERSLRKSLMGEFKSQTCYKGRILQIGLSSVREKYCQHFCCWCLHFHSSIWTYDMLCISVHFSREN